jgi:hypothetical protein
MIEPAYDKSIEFLQAFRPTGFWVLTAISPDKKSIETRSFASTEPSETLAWLRAKGEAHNIYFSVNPTTKPMRKKAEREDIAAMAHLHVDIDPRPGRELESERRRTLAMLTDKLPESVPPPTWIIDSGGGYWAFWKLREPFAIEADSARYEEAKRYNVQLEVLFDGDGCHNVDRIGRLPGTINRPDANKVSKGRSTRLASIVFHDPDRVYDLSQFTPAPLVQDASGLGFTGQLVKIPSGNIQRLEHIDDLGTAINDQCKQIIVQGDDPDDPRRFPSRSEAVFYVCCSLVRGGVPDEVIYSILTDPKFRISESILETGRRSERYALRQIERAKEDAIDPWLRKLNERHAVIGDVGGKCRIISESHDEALDRSVLSYQSFDDFRNRYGNVMIPMGDEKEMPLGHWWTRHAQRRQYENVVFAPGREMPGSYNLWKGFAVEAKPGNCGMFLDHCKRNICSGDEDVYKYLLGWMATAVQHPAQQGHVAVVMRGKKGAGKGKFANVFGRLFGRHFLPVVDAKHLVGNFNAHLRDCSILFADEAFYAGDKKHESILKSLITEDTLMVEGKGADAIAARNYLHIIMASNEDWVIPAGAGERRFLMLNVADANVRDHGFFSRMDKEQDNGGREALLHYLLHYDLSGFDVRAVPSTEALRQQQVQSFAPEAEWWFAKLMEGEMFPGEGWPTHVVCSHLAWDFVCFLKTFNIHLRSGGTKLGQFLGKALPNKGEKVQIGRRMAVITEQGEQRTVDRPRAYQIPSLEEARAHFDTQYGGPHAWQDSLRTVSATSASHEEPF